MKSLMCLAVACVVLLSGCPDSKMPKAPPKVPEPKAVVQGASAPAPAMVAVQARVAAA